MDADEDEVVSIILLENNRQYESGEPILYFPISLFPYILIPVQGVFPCCYIIGSTSALAIMRRRNNKHPYFLISLFPYSSTGLCSSAQARTKLLLQIH